MNRAEKAQESRQEGTRHVSGIMGAKNGEGHSAARTGGASDLPELRSQEELDRMAELEFSEYGRGPRTWYLVWVAVGLGIWGALAWMIA